MSPKLCVLFVFLNLTFNITFASNENENDDQSKSEELCEKHLKIFSEALAQHELWALKCELTYVCHVF